MIKRTLLRTILIFLLLAAAPTSLSAVHAQDNKLGTPFTVTPVYPDNQSQGVTGYFNLNVSPDAKQTIYFNVTNETESPLTMNVTPANALTSEYGGIQYTPDNGSEKTRFTDPSFAIRGIFSTDSSIALEPRSTKKVPVTVSVPQTDTGTYLGGLLFSSDQANSTSTANPDSKNATFIMNNRLVIAIAVQLNLPKSFEAKPELGKVGVQSIASGSQLFIKMSNDAPQIAKEYKGTYEVLTDSGKSVMHGQFGPFNMAPRTEIAYPIFWDNTLAPGTYHAKVNAAYGSQQISKDASFTIGVKELKEFHDATGRNPIPFTIPWWVYAVVALFLAGILYFVYWLGTRNKRSKDVSG